MSVSLTVFQSDANAPADAAREYWNERFERFEVEKGEKENDGKEPRERGKEGEEEKASPPKKIEGIGEKAFWSGNRVGGALYVLKNDFIVRVSVGGPDDEKAKTEKSKALSAKVLSRLP